MQLKDSFTWLITPLNQLSQISGNGMKLSHFESQLFYLFSVGKYGAGLMVSKILSKLDH